MNYGVRRGFYLITVCNGRKQRRGHAFWRILRGMESESHHGEIGKPTMQGKVEMGHGSICGEAGIPKEWTLKAYGI